MIRIGVTGHRSFDGMAAARAAAIRILTALIAERSDGDRRIEVWSSLAEGADRMVIDAARAIDPGARLVAVLPLPADDYRSDFTDPASATEFDRLLATAADVRIVGGASRTEAYLRAGLAVADAGDVLLAVWDGGPARGDGDTAEVVAAARAGGREVVVIPVARPAETEHTVVE